MQSIKDFLNTLAWVVFWFTSFTGSAAVYTNKVPGEDWAAWFPFISHYYLVKYLVNNYF